MKMSDNHFMKQIKYCLRFLPDKLYLQIYYLLRLKKRLNLKNPKTFNEKLQWLKLYDRKPEYTQMVDKYAAKKYIADKIGEEYIIPTLGVWDDFDEIDFDSLPDQFVLKCTHDSGGVVICKDKATFNKETTLKIIKRALKYKFFYIAREWPYKNIKPRIIAEEYLDCINSSKFVEYKIFCFNGEPKLFLVCKGNAHGAGRTNDFYDLDFNHIPVTVTYPNSSKIEEKPAEYEEIINIARELSKGIPQLRVDTYVANGKVYVGEMTFYHDSGCCRFNPESYDVEFGKLINLPNESTK